MDYRFSNKRKKIMEQLMWREKKCQKRPFSLPRIIVQKKDIEDDL